MKRYRIALSISLIVAGLVVAVFIGTPKLFAINRDILLKTRTAPSDYHSTEFVPDAHTLGHQFTGGQTVMLLVSKRDLNSGFNPSSCNLSGRHFLPVDSWYTLPGKNEVPMKFVGITTIPSHVPPVVNCPGYSGSGIMIATPNGYSAKMIVTKYQKLVKYHPSESHSKE